MMTSCLTITLNPAIDQAIFLDQFHHGKVNNALRSYQYAGGKGINVASCLADWGIQAHALGLLGDLNSHIFEDHFHQRGIHDACVRIPGQTRTNLKLIEPNGVTTDLNLAGLPADGSHLKVVSDRLAALVKADTVVVLAGSLPPGLPENAWAGLLALAQGRGARVLLDSSGPALQAVLESSTTPLPFAIKPNRFELEKLVGRTLDHVEAVHSAAKSWVNRGIRLVVTSMGADGALFVTAKQALIARPKRFAKGSSVGAGDAMVAGLASGLQHRDADLNLDQCARLATAFSLNFLESGDQRRLDQAEVRKIAQDAVSIDYLPTP